MFQRTRRCCSSIVHSSLSCTCGRQCHIPCDCFHMSRSRCRVHCSSSLHLRSHCETCLVVPVKRGGGGEGIKGRKAEERKGGKEEEGKRDIQSTEWPFIHIIHQVFAPCCTVYQTYQYPYNYIPLPSVHA